VLLDTDPPTPDGRDPFFSRGARVVWRLGTDYVLNGDDRAKEALAPMTAWIRRKRADDPFQMVDMYQLDGTALPGAQSSFSTEGPFGVAAMADQSNQSWLNAIWQHMAKNPIPNDPDGYFGDTLKMLTMIVMSGNWWAP
jgi:hypothetical protein